jgi:hypothetical protein
MNNEIILISTFCNTEEKIKILQKNILKIKNKGFDVAIITPLNLPHDVIEISDYVFFTKENPILDWPIHSMYNWKIFNLNDKKIKISQTYPDYGWAGLNHVKRLGEMFLNYNYKTYAFIIYDSVLTDIHFEKIRNSHEGIVYPSKRNNDVWKVGLHLMIFNKEMLKRVVNRITLKDYLSYKDFDAFAYLHTHIVIPLQLEIDEEPVEDEIFYYENIDILNHSIHEGVKYFISSPYEVVEDVKIFFYDITEPLNIKLKINEIETTHTVSNLDVISSNLLKLEIKSIIIEYDNKTHDLTEKLNNIKNSLITYE